MVQSTGRYIGNKKVECTHSPSGTLIFTVPPKDNQGDGSSFSPTDLVGAAFGACILSTIAIVADRDGVDVVGSHYSVEKHMAASPRRIAKLPITVHLPAHLNETQRLKLENAAKTCPVHHSVHPDIERVITFVYDV